MFQHVLNLYLWFFCFKLIYKLLQRNTKLFFVISLIMPTLETCQFIQA